MGDIAIRIDDLGKRYRLGSGIQGAFRYKSLRDTLADAAAAPFRRARSLFGQDDGQSRRNGEYIWALKDVSLEVKKGEVIGVIGRNGAGKSTLLKILSRITEPTEGEVDLYGRVGSLLEVGTGFHPELTGRENVFLNGAILGMRKAEIERKFDEIVAFAEVERFIDTPVKRYSSGMYVRLAFAVAAHLEPEILLVDEVLSVGDLAFQKKCLGKMHDVAGEGRTVLFVSHNMQAVRNLCARSILLSHGQLIYDGATGETQQFYRDLLRQQEVDAETDIRNPLNRRGSGAARFTSIEVLAVSGERSHSFRMGDTIRFRLSYRLLADVPELQVSVALRSGLTSEIVTNARHQIYAEPMPAGTTGTVVVEFPDVYIRPGEYPLYFWLGNSAAQPFDVVDDLTAPLIIYPNPDMKTLDFHASNPMGYFSLPSVFERAITAKEDET